MWRAAALSIAKLTWRQETTDTVSDCQQASSYLLACSLPVAVESGRYAAFFARMRAFKRDCRLVRRTRLVAPPPFPGTPQLNDRARLGDVHAVYPGYALAALNRAAVRTDQRICVGWRGPGRRLARMTTASVAPFAAIQTPRVSLRISSATSATSRSFSRTQKMCRQNIVVGDRFRLTRSRNTRSRVWASTWRIFFL